MKLTKLGRKLAQASRTKVKVVVDLGPAGTTTRNLTIESKKSKR